MNDELRGKRRSNPSRETLVANGFYHSFELPNGSMIHGVISLEQLRERVLSYPIPADLHGKSLLDVGPWDGYFTFEMEGRGASVTAIDYVDLDSFRVLAAAHGSRAKYIRLDVYELNPAIHGQFDYVLFLGVLYHLKHPLLGLERACSVTRELCIVETFVSDAPQWLNGERSTFPVVELYEHDELGGQLDNWCGPSVCAVETLIRQAGFAEAQLLGVYENVARFAAWRRWRHLPPAVHPAVELRKLSSHSHRGRSFQTSKEEYVQLWCAWEAADPDLASVYPEIDEFGVAPLAVSIRPDGLLISVRLPPGLLPGEHFARVKIGESHWSERLPFFVDLPPASLPISLVAVQDGITWKSNEVSWNGGGWFTLWADGLTTEADPGNTTVEFGAVPHTPVEVIPSRGQINCQLRSIMAPGDYAVHVRHRGAISNAVTVAINGNPPPSPISAKIKTLA